LILGIGVVEVEHVTSFWGTWFSSNHTIYQVACKITSVCIISGFLGGTRSSHDLLQDSRSFPSSNTPVFSIRLPRHNTLKAFQEPGRGRFI
jgi:hypothetical protein